jgi:hypothetical protein
MWYHLFSHGVAGNISDSVSDRLDLIGLSVRDFYGELFLNSHYNFDGIQGVKIEIFLEAGVGRDLALVDLRRKAQGWRLESSYEFRKTGRQ